MNTEWTRTVCMILIVLLLFKISLDSQDVAFWLKAIDADMVTK